DMARARFALGQLDEARESLLELREERPPDAARQVIDEYLQAIEQRQSGTELSAYAELGLGHDSNVANATARESVFVPVLGTSVSLSGSSTQRADAFGALRVGARWDQEIARGWSSSIGADIRARLYRKRVEFDEVDPQLHGTLQYRSGFNTVAVNARHEQMDLDYEQYRKVLSVGVTWIRDVDTSLQLVGFAQHSRVRYTSDANSSSDSNLFLFGVGGVWQPGSRRLTALSGSVYGGRDNDTKARIDGDGALVGLRLGLNHRISADLEGSVVGGAQLTHYDIQNGLFQRKRNDRFAELQGVLRWQFEPLWSLSPQLKLTRNWSNIDINSYQRLEAAVFVRRDFR
ncbi:MAG: DUF560 domain-containing protein, partial [Gammaproteobacteria bacterium]|nr:DUF560 domain-containing protein [Gammaproteobacteria bacterium]